MDILSALSVRGNGIVLKLGTILGNNVNGVKLKSYHTSQKISKNLIKCVIMTMIKNISRNYVVCVNSLVTIAALEIRYILLKKVMKKNKTKTSMNFYSKITKIQKTLTMNSKPGQRSKNVWSLQNKNANKRQNNKESEIKK